jgi:hypothetical protein
MQGWEFGFYLLEGRATKAYCQREDRNWSEMPLILYQMPFELMWGCD